MSYLDKFKLEAVVAALGFNDGANNGFWRIQPRAAKGRQGAGQWIEMGAELRALLKVKGKVVSVIGRSVGSNGTPDGVRVLFQGLADQGIPDSIVEIPTRFLDLVSAALPEELLKKKGIDSPDAAAEPDQNVPNFEDLQRAEITPDDIRIANEGINSPEGKEQAAFKDSAEGKAIEANEAVDDAVEKLREAMDTGTEEDQIAATEELRKAREIRDADLKDPAEMTDEELKKESSSPMPTNVKRSNKIFEEINKRAGNQSPLDLDRQRYEDGIVAEEQRVNEIIEPIAESLRKAAGDDPEIFKEAFDAMDDDLLTGDEKLQAVANAIKIQKLGDMKGPKEKARQAQYKALKTLEAEGIDIGNINRTGSTPEEDRAIDGPNGKTTPVMRRAAVKKAARDIADGKPVTVDDVIEYASKGEPKPFVKPVGRKINVKGLALEPGDIFESRGEEYSFIERGERDRASGTVDVKAKNLRTGKTETVVVDTNKEFPALRPDKSQPAPKPEPTPEAEAPKAPEAAPVAPIEPTTPEAPAAPSAPEAEPVRPADINTIKPSTKKVSALPRKPKVATPVEKARDEGRQDKGELVSLPDISEEELFNEKITPLLDENGNALEFYNPSTGKVQVAGNGDAIEEAIFKRFPNAVVTKQGQILVERKDLEPLTGEPSYLSMFIERTHGNGFYVGFNTTSKAGFDPENPIKGDSYYHYDIRDSFASIFGNKKNGLYAISRMFSGEQSPIKNQNSKEYKAYFGPGKTFNDRLKYFRNKYRSNVTEEQLIDGLRQARRDKNDVDILRFKTDLRLLRVDFNGDINKFREYDSLQNYRMITLAEMYDRYSAGRSGYTNKSLDQLERQQRSAIKGVYEAIASGDRVDATASLQELAYRTPMLSRNKIAADVMLKSISDGFKARLPKENKRTLGALKTNAFLALQDSQSIEAQKGAPHMSKDGVVLKPGFLVEYTSNDKKKTKSIGTVVGLRQLARGKYTDKVYVVFKNSNGKFTPPIELSSTKMSVLDETGYSERDPQSALKLPGTREQMTKYTPDIGGLDLVEQRGGEKAVKAKIAYINSRQSDPNELDNPDEDPELDSPNLGSEGIEGDSEISNDSKRTEDLVAGDILYSKDGEVLGQIVSIKPVKSKSGKPAFAVQFIDKNGDVGKPAILQPGELRGPKA
jgi:hypothetical protein